LALAYSNKATGIQANESLIETNYDVQVFGGVNFTPDFQYVIHPNAERAIRDAVVFGFKAHVEF
jgi:porin